ncbi:peptidoglycan-binding protein [Streptomyces sp. NPDC093510]|uniref:peptidoglycan-binding protein n=1 Tax=Streptomyces sp. NPDC093510 TaxID=3155199 RepID=UPI0034470E3B
MEAAPVFEEFTPESDCDCPGCIHWRRTTAHALPLRLGGHPAAHGARRALVLAAAAGTVLGGQTLPAVASVEVGGRAAAPGAGPADDVPGDVTDTPQGGTSPLHGGHGAAKQGSSGPPGYRATTRAAIIDRAKEWVAAKVPYDMGKYWPDGYRQDCSGFVSMAWNLGGNEWTGSLGKYATPISKDQLQPGDILLFHNPADPTKGSHVTVFGGWSDSARTHYLAYELARPHARRQTTPYAYWTYGNRYLAYRYKGVTGGSPGGSGTPGPSTRYPGAKAFGPGAENQHVTRLGEALVARGGKRFYRTGPGPRWSDADRRATQAFQLAQGWRGRDADGLPGPTTWTYLMKGKGRDIPAGRAGAGGGGGKGDGRGDGGGGGDGKGGTGSGSAFTPGGGVGVPAYPGRGVFRPGRSHAAIERLGRQLVSRGFGTHYARGPGPSWSESDRRNVEAFQRSQGWRGAAADGFPGPETWRRLFR